MTTDLQVIKHVDVTTKNLVFGFVRECENTLLSSNIISDLIIYTILIYFYCCDQWFKEALPNSMKISGTNENIVTFSNNYATGTVFGTKVIDSGIFKWKLKINKIGHKGNQHMPYIGITEIQYRSQENNKRNELDQFGYCLCGGKALKRDQSNSNGVPINHAFFKYAGDILQFTLDLNKLQIRLVINDTDFGVIWSNIKKTTYCLALNVSLASKKTEIELL